MSLKWFINLLYLAILLALILALAWLFSSIIGYFVISLVIATLLRPVTDYFSEFYFFQNRMPKALAVLLSFLFLIAILTFFVLLFIPLISEQVRILSSVNVEASLSHFSSLIAAIEKFLINVLHVDKEPGFLSSAIHESLFSFLDEIELSSVINFTLQFSAAFFVSLLAIVFITFFLLYEKGLLRRNIIKLIPNRYFELTITALHKIETLLSNYLRALLLQIFFIFSLTATGLTIIGINYALTIAIFAALVNVVPYIGPIIGTTFAIIVGISTTAVAGTANSALLLAVKIILVALIVHFIDNLFLQPLVFSKSVKAHPLEIFVAIFAGAAVAGPLGMIAAIPVYTVLRVSFIEFKKGSKQYHIFKE